MKVGDTVTWKSRVYNPEKTGKIIAFIPAGSDISPLIPKDAKIGHIKAGSEKSIYDRVLIAVPAGKDGRTIHYYAPTEKTIREQNKI